MNPNSNKRLFINLSANIVSYSVNILIAFVLTPYLINTLGKEAYSFYPIANNFVSYMGILTVALNSMCGRFVTVSIVKNEMDDAKRYVSSVLFSNIVMGLFLTIPMITIIVFIDKILNVPVNIVVSVRFLFCFVFASMLVHLLSSVFGIATFVRNRIDLRSVMQLISGIIKIFLFYTLFKFFTPTIVYVGVVAFVVAVSEFLFQMFYFKKLLPGIRITTKYFSLKHVRKVLSSGCWNSINSIGNLLLVSSSLIMANILYGAASGGIYSIVSTVPLFINGVISMLVGVFSPSITFSFAEGHKQKLVHVVEKSQSIVGLFSCSVIAVFVCLSKDFFKLWTPLEDANQLFILSSITIMPHFFIGCLWPITNLNVAANKVAKPAIVQFVLGFLNVFLVVFFSTMFQTGIMTICIICSLLTIMLVLGFMPVYAAHYLHVSYFTFYKVVLKMLVGTVVAMTIMFYVKNWFVLDDWLNLLSVSAIMGIVTLCINFMFMFNRDTRNKIIMKFFKK